MSTKKFVILKDFLHLSCEQGTSPEAVSTQFRPRHADN